MTELQLQIDSLYPPPITLAFDGELSPEEKRMITEGLLDDFEWPVWL